MIFEYQQVPKSIGFEVLLMEIPMNDNLLPTDLKGFETQFLLQIDQLREGIVTLLTEALQACPENQKTGLCERAFLMNDSLETMHTILWRMVSLVDRAKGEETPRTDGDRNGNSDGHSGDPLGA